MSSFKSKNWQGIHQISHSLHPSGRLSSFCGHPRMSTSMSPSLQLINTTSPTCLSTIPPVCSPPNCLLCTPIVNQGIGTCVGLFTLPGYSQCRIFVKNTCWGNCWHKQCLTMSCRQFWLSSSVVRSGTDLSLEESSLRKTCSLILTLQFCMRIQGLMLASGAVTLFSTPDSWNTTFCQWGTNWFSL